MTPRRLWLAVALLCYLGLATYQLELPGLHYDEAREAGLNAMEIVTGAPITAFRGAGIPIGGRTYPVMVQDYIGALNVYLALPFLALTGVGVPNLRILPVLSGLLVLVLVERTVSEWVAWLWARQRPRSRADDAQPPAGTPIAIAGLLAVSLLAVSPGFVFWSRQGIFVTNLTQVFVFLCLWQGVRWLRTGAPATLIVAALAAGLALYAKLLAIWIVGPFAMLAAGWWIVQRVRGNAAAPLTVRTFLLALLAFLLPLLPLIWFNVQTGGTFASIGGNLGESYYGVRNSNIAANLAVRVGQVQTLLKGDQFWYLGAVYANRLAPWLAVVVLILGLLRNWRLLAMPLALLALAVGASIFTVSDLFITHYALVQPLLLAVAGLAMAAALGGPPDAERYAGEHASNAGTRSSLAISQLLIGAIFVAWLAADLANTWFYHRALTQSGGLADHSDATYHLAYDLRYNGMGAPLALDWGIDAPVRYLSQGTVTPIEIFGYASPTMPDDAFEARLAPFLENTDNVYLLHSEGATVFAGRRQRFLAAAARARLKPVLERTFAQRDGAPLYELWKLSAE